MRAYLPWILTAVAGPLLGWVVYSLRAKTDVWRMTKQADISVAQLPFKVLQDALALRDKENAEMRGELRLIVTNHLSHDAEDRGAIVKALTELTAAQRELTGMLREDRAQSGEWRKTMHERMTEIQLEVARKAS